MKNGNSIVPVNVADPATGKLYIQEFDDRHGKRVLYYRRAGFKPSKIKWVVGQTVEAFLSAYGAAVVAAVPKVAPKADAKPQAERGTVAWLVWGYLDSYEFEKRPDSVRVVFRRHLTKLAGLKVGATSAKHFATSEQVGKLLLKFRATPHKGNEWRDAMNGMFKWAASKGHVATNPVPGTDTLAPVKAGGFHVWTLAEVEQYRAAHALGTTARLALELAYWEGFRPSDLFRVGPQSSQPGDEGPEWNFEQWKYHGTKKAVWRVGPVQPAMVEMLAEHYPGLSTTGPYLQTVTGRKFSRATFTKAFRQWCDDAGLKHCTAHGIRKRGGNDIAQNGGTTKEVMAFLGHGSEASSKPYTAAAERRLLSEAATTKRAAAVVAEQARRATRARRAIVKPAA